MIDSLLQQTGEPNQWVVFREELAVQAAMLRASVGGGDRRQVARAEAVVSSDPQTAFRFEADGSARLSEAAGGLPAGRFEPMALGALRRRALADRAAGAGSGRLRLWVLDGVSPLTDIGSLQATAGPGTLFQVASQFNGLESPGPYVTPVSCYLSDPTQGPRASISAYPGALLRHYAAPDGAGGRFTQRTDGPQLNFLGEVCAPGVAEVRSGYLTSHGVHDRDAFIAAIERGFENICVGVHDGLPVLLGHDWDGAVLPNAPRIAQVFASTFAGGLYSAGEEEAHLPICTLLLRAAYLGTLLAGAVLQRPKVVLTMIGGGVFGNPPPLIWDSIQWAIREVQPCLARDMDVVLNARELQQHLSLEEILPVVRATGGLMLELGGAEPRLLR
ncbi:hypothetical protein JI742_11580 [Piscinibacter sp. Jin2]|uniref:Uncharacterized protein n=1 Tax=Aquariibacter lacus TaxID=2801332 RepID=A0A9X1BNV7_9BURK|nr:hypothetical protein [Piscinibacter lacus]MBL0720527.1 hypothetical protein [Piscinibacter lacus]